uniref:Clathrin light chain n=1 Tax=Cacopsylla melanoneura TaxID=428564 RepID=A0A8D9EZB5_9HEMI
MDGFGDNFDDNDVDPAAEFIAREQNQLAGLEDEVEPVVASLNSATISDAFQPQAEFTNEYEFVSNDNEPDIAFNSPQLVGAGFNEQTNGNGIMFDVESSPSFNNTVPVAPVLNGHSSPHEDEASVASPSKSSERPKIFSQPPTPAKTPPIREEPEKIKKWREAQKQRLEDKDAEEEKKKEEMRKAAKSELEEWYHHHEELIAKTKAANRESALNAEKQFVAETDDIEPGTEWERIAKLCDFNPKVGRTNKDVSRMRSIILQLKQTPLKKN